MKLFYNFYESKINPGDSPGEQEVLDAGYQLVGYALFRSGVNPADGNPIKTKIVVATCSVEAPTPIDNPAATLAWNEGSAEDLPSGFNFERVNPDPVCLDCDELTKCQLDQIKAVFGLTEV